MKKLYTLKDAAGYLSVCERTMWSLGAPHGPIPCVRIGRAVRFDERDLDAFIEGQKIEGKEMENSDE